MSEGISEAATTTIREYVDAHPFLSWIGLRIEMLEPGTAHLSVPYTRKLANPGEPHGLHGGVSSAVLDAAGAVALSTMFDDPPSAIGQASVSTIDLNVSYLRPARDDLVVEAEAVHVGGSTGVARMVASSTDDEGQETDVVVGRGTYRLFR